MGSVAGGPVDVWLSRREDSTLLGTERVAGKREEKKERKTSHKHFPPNINSNKQIARAPSNSNWYLYHVTSLFNNFM